MARTQTADRPAARTRAKRTARSSRAQTARDREDAPALTRSEREEARERSEAEPSGARPLWSGTITFGLVSVPVQLWPAVRSAGVRMRMLSPAGLPLKRRYVCPKEERDVTRDEIVRGFELDDGKHVTLTDEELESVAPRKSRDIDLRRFVAADELDPFLFERTYVLTPAGQTEKPYRLLADVMEREDKAGIATFVMRDKEYLVAIFAEGGILQAETLRFADEVRTPKDVGLPSPAKAKPAAKEISAFERAIRKLEKSEIARAELRDERLERLRDIVERKRKRDEDVVLAPVAPADASEAVDEEETADVDLIEAIRRSMRGEGDAATRAPARRAEGRPSRRSAVGRTGTRARATKRASTASRKSSRKPARARKSSRKGATKSKAAQRGK